MSYLPKIFFETLCMMTSTERFAEVLCGVRWDKYRHKSPGRIASILDRIPSSF